MGDRNRHGQIVSARVSHELALDVDALAKLRGVSRSELLSTIARKEVDVTLQVQIEQAQAAVDALETGDPETAAEILQALIKTAMKSAPTEDERKAGVTHEIKAAFLSRNARHGRTK